jgi:hypothetical protein
VARLCTAAIAVTTTLLWSAGAASAPSNERGSPGAVQDEIADLWLEALVERYAVGGGRVVVSEKPDAPYVAVCVATLGPAVPPGSAAADSDPGLRVLQMRGGTLDATSGAGASAWCATLPAGELALGMWLAGNRVRQRAAQSAEQTDSAVVTSESRAAALAAEGASMSGQTPPDFAIAVSGGVAASDVVSLAEKTFGESANHADIQRTSLAVHQSSERLSVVEAPVPAPRARYGFIAGGDSKQRAALAVATEVLAGGTSSRLHRDLVVRRLLAHSVSPWRASLTGGALFGLDFEISTRTSLDRARRFIDGAIKQLRLVGPSRGELRRAKSSLERRALLDWENPTARAKRLSVYELTQSDGRAWLEEMGEIRTLTEETVRKVAHDELVDARRTTVETYPPLWPEDDPKLSQYRTYTVEPGDVLSDVASRFGVTVQSIARANDLDPRYRLMTGQALLIPPK